MTDNIKIIFQLENTKSANKYKSQPRQKLDIPKNAFIIEGGGTRGTYAIGILQYLFDENPYINLNKIDIFGGTSVGSFLAVPLSLGFNKQDLDALSKIIDVSALTEPGYKFMLTAYRFLSTGYLYDDTGRENIIKQILNYKIDKIREDLSMPNLIGENLTFGHLCKLIELQPQIYKHLLINAVDISRAEQIFMTTLDHTYDNIKLIDAILASSSIPFVFKPVNLYFDGTYHYNETPNSTFNCLVDGGTSTGNPLDFFLLNRGIYSNYTLWLIKFTSEPQYVKIDSFKSMLNQLIEYTISGKNNTKMNLIENKYHTNIINLHSKAGTLDIYTQEQIQKIIQDIYQKCVNGELFFNN